MGRTFIIRQAGNLWLRLLVRDLQIRGKSSLPQYVALSTPDFLIQFRDLSGEVGQRLFQHFTMKQIATGLKLLGHAIAGEEQAFLVAKLGCGLRVEHCFVLRCVLSRSFDLCLDGLAFPASRH